MIDIFWDDESKKVLCWQFPPRWTWDDYHAAVAKSTQMVQDTPHRVDKIIDMRDAPLIPEGVFTHVGYMSYQRPSNLGAVVVVSRSAFLRTVYEAFRRFYRLTHRTAVEQIFLVPTPEAAYTLIARQSPAVNR